MKFEAVNERARVHVFEISLSSEVDFGPSCRRFFGKKVDLVSRDLAIFLFDLPLGRFRGLSHIFPILGSWFVDRRNVMITKRRLASMISMLMQGNGLPYRDN